MLPESEIEYRRRWPNKAARTSRLVATCMRIGQRRCAGGECDLGKPCRRHRLADAVAERLERMRAR